MMPYVEGESLRERLDREKQLGVEDSLSITQKVAGGGRITETGLSLGTPHP